VQFPRATHPFDTWMVREFPTVPFERYADDAICHCQSEAQAKRLKDAIQQRLSACHLELHPTKTKIVFCKDDRRRQDHPEIQFDFLGFAFRPRVVKGKNGEMFVGFTPAISPKAAKLVRQTVREWRLHLRSGSSIEDLAKEINPITRGWINYYGVYYRSALYRVFDHLDSYLTRWAMRKYKGLKNREVRTRAWLQKVQDCQPQLFARWSMLPSRAG
jgi:RNA-directed DNA polymerase